MKLLKMEVTPFTRLEYLSNDFEKEWSPCIQKVRGLTNLGEILMVEKGHRLASTCQLTKDKMQNALKNFKSRRLIFTPIRWVKNFDGFAHLHVYSTEDDPDAICYGVVTRNKKDGEWFRKADGGIKTDHDIIGELLGYPSCCRKFFNEVWSKGYIDPIWQQAENTGGEICRESYGYSISIKGYPECVAMQRYWGVRVSFHMPCSFQCEETKKLAQTWYAVMNEIGADAVDAVRRILSLPATWDAHKGVAVVNTPYYKGMTSSVPCADVYTVYYNPIS